MARAAFVPFIIVTIEKDQFRPQVCFLTSTNHPRHVYTGPEQLEMLHHPVRIILGQYNAKACEHGLVRTLKTQPGLEE